MDEMSSTVTSPSGMGTRMPPKLVMAKSIGTLKYLEPYSFNTSATRLPSGRSGLSRSFIIMRALWPITTFMGAITGCTSRIREANFATSLDAG